MVVWWCAFCCCRKEDPRETKIVNWDSPRKKVNKEDPHQHHHSQPGLIRTDQTETREDQKETRCCLQSGDDRLSLRFWAAVEPTQRQEFQCYFISRFNIWIGHLICGDRRGRVPVHDFRTNKGIDQSFIISISSDRIMFFTVKRWSFEVSVLWYSFKSAQTTVGLYRMEMNALWWTKQGTISSADRRGSRDNNRRHTTTPHSPHKWTLSKRLWSSQGSTWGVELSRVKNGWNAISLSLSDRWTKVSKFGPFTATFADLSRWPWTACPSRESFCSVFLNWDPLWEFFCFAIKSLGRRVSGVESQRSAVRLHVHACSSSTLWWIIEMSSPNPHVSSGWRLVPDTLMFPVVGRVCRTRCCDVVVSVPMLLTCSGDEEGEWIDFETGIIYILKNFLYIMKIFPYLLKMTIFKQPIKAT